MSARATLVLALLLAGVTALSLAVPWRDLAALFGEGEGLAWAVLLELRAPRTMLALVYGATLAASGAAVRKPGLSRA